MSYTEETILRAGVPQTVLAGGLQARGIAKHWTAGRPGRAGGLATLQFFIDRDDRNASYHGLVYWEGGELGVIWIVPLSRAAHSMNPTQPPNGPWAPVAEVRRILGDQWWNPNSASIALAFCGMPADLDAALAAPGFISAYTELVRELIRTTPTLRDRPLFNHGWGQPSTRFDAGTRLIPALYAGLAKEDEMEIHANWPEDWRPTVNPSGASNGVLRAEPERSAPVVERVPVGTVIRSTAEIRTTAFAKSKDDGDWRLHPADDGSSLYMLRSDWEPLTPGGDPTLRQQFGAFVAREPADERRVGTAATHLSDVAQALQTAQSSLGAATTALKG